MTAYRRNLLAEQASTRWAHDKVDEDWKGRAECRNRDGALWFPKTEGVRNGSKRVRDGDRIARAICEICPVMDECLAYAIALDLRYGTWGGMTEIERSELTGRPVDRWQHL